MVTRWCGGLRPWRRRSTPGARAGGEVGAERLAAMCVCPGSATRLLVPRNLCLFWILTQRLHWRMVGWDA